jgi:hypothetical protein
MLRTTLSLSNGRGFHANITALEAVLDDVSSQQVEAVYCLGDLVGYAAHANEVIDRIHRDPRQRSSATMTMGRVRP